MSVSIAPVSDQSASRAPPRAKAIPELDCCSVTRRRLPSTSVTASLGTTPSSLLTMLEIASASPTRPKTPTATSSSDGIARNA